MWHFKNAVVIIIIIIQALQLLMMHSVLAPYLQHGMHDALPLS